MTSDRTSPRRLTRVDRLILRRSEHYYLCEDDECYFIGEYTAGRGWDHSPTNQLISNFKKEMDRRDLPEWRYKRRAIRQAALAFRTALEPLDEATVRGTTFVPIPPSKAKDDPGYDDRMTQMLNLIRPEPSLDVREIIVQANSTDPVHLSGVRLSPEEIEDGYGIDESLTAPPPHIIGIVDDVLTTGAHYRAAQVVLSSRFPKARIIGLFIARRVPETLDLDDLTF